MSKHNAATRVLAIAERVRTLDQTSPVVDGWAVLFGVETQDAVQRGLQVAQSLGLLHHQVGTIRSELAARAFEPSAYEPHLDRVSRSLVLTSLGNKWSWVAGHYPEEVLSALRLLPGILPDEEETVGQDEIKQIRKLIAELRSRVAKSGLPPAVTAFLEEQLNLVELALREYPIRGVAAFRDASEQAAISWLRSRELIVKSGEKPEVQEVAGLWMRIQGFVKKAALISTLAYHLLSTVDKAIHMGDELPLLLAPSSEQEAPPDENEQKAPSEAEDDSANDNE